MLSEGGQPFGICGNSFGLLSGSILLTWQVEPILEGLKDGHPYVQSTAVMGVLKVHHIDQSVAESRGNPLPRSEGQKVFLEGLVSVVSDLMYSAEDPQVLGNCLYAIAAVLLSLKNRWP